MSQKIVQLLYKTTLQLAREIYVALLDQLCHSFEEVAKEAINWLIYAEDEVRLFFVEVITAPNSIISSAQVQRPGDGHVASQRSDQHPARGPTACEVLVC